MKSESTLRRELTRVQRALDASPVLRKLTPEEAQAEQYGAMTALAWALGQDTCAPHKLAPSTPSRSET